MNVTDHWGVNVSSFCFYVLELSGTGETRGAATGEGVDLARKRKIRRRKYERKEAYRSNTTVTQAIMMVSRSQ